MYETKNEGYTVNNAKNQFFKHGHLTAIRGGICPNIELILGLIVHVTRKIEEDSIKTSSLSVNKVLHIISLEIFQNAQGKSSDLAEIRTYYTPRNNEVIRGVYCFHVCPGLRPSVTLFP